MYDINKSKRERIKTPSNLLSLYLPVIVLIFVMFNQTLITYIAAYLTSEYDWYGSWSWFEPFYLGIWESMMKYIQFILEPNLFIKYMQSVWSLMTWNNFLNWGQTINGLKYIIIFIKISCQSVIFLTSGCKS